MLMFDAMERLEREDPSGYAYWRAAMDEAATLDPADYLFHGTCLEHARSILEIGFRWRNHILDDIEHLHVYWGSLDYTSRWARRSAMGGDRPALLCARIADVVASGTALPMTSEDRQCDGEPELADWRASLADNGCLRVRHGVRVSGLRILGPWADLGEIA